MPKFLRHVPKFYKYRPYLSCSLRKYALINLLLALLVAHYLIVYRQPVKFLIGLSSAESLLGHLVLTPLIWLWIQYISFVTLILWRRVPIWFDTVGKRLMIVIHVTLQVFLCLGLPIFTASELLHLYFHLSNLVIDEATYGNLDFVAFKSFMVVYNLVVIGWLLLNTQQKEKKQSKHRLKLFKEERQNRILLEYGENLNRLFMVLTMKNYVIEITISGQVSYLKMEKKELNELLGHGFVQVNRWTYVKLQSVLGMDIKDERVYLSKREEELFSKIPMDKGLLKLFDGKLKHRYGLLALTNTYGITAVEKWERYKMDRADSA